MSRRSSRRTPKKAAISLSAGTSTGLSSLIEGNETTIASMLSVSIPKNNDTTSSTSSSATKTKLMEALTDCMAMNNLSAEALLARFFNVTMLRRYCEDRLDVSSKGNEATLAARIARAWSKPNFEPLPFKQGGGGGTAAADESKASSKKSDMEKKGRSSSKDVDDSTKKRGGEKQDDDNNPKGSDEKKESSTKKRKVWVSAETQPSETVTVPPGPLGFTIKKYSTDYVVTDIRSSAIQPGKIRTGDVILAIDNFEIQSETDDILKESDKSREITIAGRVISMKAADRPRGTLLYLKEIRAPMFRIMDYSGVAEKYGEEFMEELNPPNRGKSGGSILAGALSSLSAGRK